MDEHPPFAALPELPVEVYRSHWRPACDERAFMLHAVGIASQVVGVGSNWSLVRRADVRLRRAFRHLRTYDRENPPRARAASPRRPAAARVGRAAGLRAAAADDRVAQWTEGVGHELARRRRARHGRVSRRRGLACGHGAHAALRRGPPARQPRLRGVLRLARGTVARAGRRVRSRHARGRRGQRLQRIVSADRTRLRRRFDRRLRLARPARGLRAGAAAPTRASAGPTAGRR